MITNKFNLTNAYMTQGINYLVEQSILTVDKIGALLKKHTCNIDDSKYEEDIAMNEEAINTGDGRVVSVYDCNDNRVYIITYLVDHKAVETTIMLADEY